MDLMILILFKSRNWNLRSENGRVMNIFLGIETELKKYEFISYWVTMQIMQLLKLVYCLKE